MSQFLFTCYGRVDLNIFIFASKEHSWLGVNVWEQLEYRFLVLDINDKLSHFPMFVIPLVLR